MDLHTNTYLVRFQKADRSSTDPQRKLLWFLSKIKRGISAIPFYTEYTVYKHFFTKLDVKVKGVVRIHVLWMGDTLK